MPVVAAIDARQWLSFLSNRDRRRKATTDAFASARDTYQPAPKVAWRASFEA
jgi:hypothetical protein